jgi:small subunit ribosomal protein S6e
MAEFKIVINNKEKSIQKELKGETADYLIGKKMGEKVAGDNIGLEGYEFEITGGSDNCGFPMRKDLPGTARRKILSTKTQGLKIKDRGILKRKNMAGNTINDKTSQINLKVLKEGKEKLEAPVAEAK